MAIPAGELLFLDTNILVAATDVSRPLHAVARKLIARGRSAGLPGATSGQVIREYIVVATRPPSANGLGLSSADALRNIAAMTGRLEFCDESEAVSVRLRALVAAGNLTGVAVHDANIAATAAVHGISHIATENPEDFAGYPELGIVRLAELADRLSADGGGR
jgi:predicted nucleic acid-binding protein